MARMMLLVLSFCALNTWAQQVVDIYRVEAPVANQSEVERIAVAKATMGDVITRVTGDAATAQLPLVRQAINDAPNFLTKYTYSSDKTIILHYSPQAIQTLLQQAQGANADVGGVTLRVVGVRDFSSFKQVQAYLKSIGLIRTIELVSVEKDVMVFKLLLDGSEELLKTALAGGDKLQALDSEKPMTFRWQK